MNLCKGDTRILSSINQLRVQVPVYAKILNHINCPHLPLYFSFSHFVFFLKINLFSTFVELLAFFHRGGAPPLKQFAPPSETFVPSLKFGPKTIGN